ncbi:hypothetical protein RJP21_03490 [Paenibacillus sp. VCA1]|uniref:hypothetical protein n=1 Tax=Paenibacillus sp. VCA1 TaxID=3039148 RepID=UPI00287181CF|nr:hypothetical protein [Paenibacillus sp. VCA1]MDR9852665.1 hypothetical protein [Paenibacillus sp. VCA1]
MKKDHVKFPLQSEQASSSQQYKLAVWHRSRGMTGEALLCFEKALSLDKTNPPSKDTSFDEPMCWLEYGRLLRQLGRDYEAGMAFRECLKTKRYITEALIEIGMFLGLSGMRDADIRIQLTAIASEFAEDAALPVAEALWALGAFSAAAELYASLGTTARSMERNQAHYILCLIYINRFKEALSLLSRKAMHHDRVLLTTSRHMIRAAEAANLCKWCLHGINGGGIGMPALSRYEALETAKTAIALGKVDEALAILSSPTEHEYNELIYTLYKQGYRELAASRISEMECLPLYDRSQISLDLCFIAAEIEYDKGNFEQAASIFEAIYTTDPNHSTARFGAASCCLQQTKASLMARLENTIVGTDLFHQIERYLDNISRALHILNITDWHTRWTPAQMRNHGAASAVVLH